MTTSNGGLKALARSAAAQLRELHDGLRLLPTVAREIPHVLPGELERRAKAARDFWAAHEPAVWAMAVTVAVLWVVLLVAVPT